MTVITTTHQHNECRKYAAMIGPRCVDVYETQEGAVQDVQTITDGWVLEVPEGSTLMDVLAANNYKGQPLYVAHW